MLPQGEEGPHEHRGREDGREGPEDGGEVEDLGWPGWERDGAPESSGPAGVLPLRGAPGQEVQGIPKDGRRMHLPSEGVCGGDWEAIHRAARVMEGRSKWGKAQGNCTGRSCIFPCVRWAGPSEESGGCPCFDGLSGWCHNPEQQCHWRDQRNSRQRSDFASKRAWRWAGKGENPKLAPEGMEGVRRAEAADTAVLGYRCSPYLRWVWHHGAQGQDPGHHAPAGQGAQGLADRAAVEGPQGFESQPGLAAKEAGAAMCDIEDLGGWAREGDWDHHWGVWPIRGVHRSVHEVWQLLQSNVDGSGHGWWRECEYGGALSIHICLQYTYIYIYNVYFLLCMAMMPSIFWSNTFIYVVADLDESFPCMW